MFELLENRLLLSTTPGDPSGDLGDDYCQQTFEIDAQEDRYELWHDKPYQSDSSVLANDISEHPCSTQKIAAVATGVAHGSLSLRADGSFSYTPEPGYVGDDGFTYVFSDGFGTDVAHVSIQVLNDLPVACNDPRDNRNACQDAGPLDQGAEEHVYSVHNDHRSEGASRGADYFSTRSVLANDVDTDRLSAEVLCGVSHGVLALYADGSFSYDPDPGYLGANSFVYRASDGAAFDTARVSLNVDGELHTRSLPFQEATDSGFVLLGQLQQSSCSEPFEPTIFPLNERQSNSQTAVYTALDSSEGAELVQRLVHGQSRPALLAGDLASWLV